MTTQRRRTSMTLLTVAAVCGLAGSPAYASEPELAMSLIQDGEVEYLSGGVSVDERQELRERALDFRVLVSFASAGHARTARAPMSVAVKLTPRRDARAAVDLTTAGPMLLLNLPTGLYDLEAKLPGGRPVVRELSLQPGAIVQLDIELPAPTPGAAVSAAGA